MRLFERLPDGWGLFKIGGIGGVRGGLVHETSDGKIIHTSATTVCSHAYVTSRTGAAVLLGAMLPVRFPYDIYLRDVYRHRATTYEVVPTLIEQGDLAGSRIAIERADGIPPFQIRLVLSYLDGSCATKFVGAVIYSARMGEGRARTEQAQATLLASRRSETFRAITPRMAASIE